MKTLSIEEKILQLKNILNKLQSNDPDPNIKIFCSVVYTEPIFYELSGDIFNDRPSLEEEHLIFLVFVSLQYLTVFYNSISQRSLTSLRSNTGHQRGC